MILLTYSPIPSFLFVILLIIGKQFGKLEDIPNGIALIFIFFLSWYIFWHISIASLEIDTLVVGDTDNLVESQKKLLRELDKLIFPSLTFQTFYIFHEFGSSLGITIDLKHFNVFLF